ncbi:MAG: hypothetical protein M1812_006278 [Candelaria pacifica]|nr:MAG: hypothetical protein M1812_006278 [Candelaria pacifica]
MLKPRDAAIRIVVKSIWFRRLQISESEVARLVDVVGGKLPDTANSKNWRRQLADWQKTWQNGTLTFCLEGVKAIVRATGGHNVWLTSTTEQRSQLFNAYYSQGPQSMAESLFNKVVDAVDIPGIYTDTSEEHLKWQRYGIQISVSICKPSYRVPPSQNSGDYRAQWGSDKPAAHTKGDITLAEVGPTVEINRSAAGGTIKENLIGKVVKPMESLSTQDFPTLILTHRPFVQGCASRNIPEDSWVKKLILARNLDTLAQAPYADSHLPPGSDNIVAGKLVAWELNGEQSLAARSMISWRSEMGLLISLLGIVKTYTITAMTDICLALGELQKGGMPVLICTKTNTAVKVIVSLITDLIFKGEEHRKGVYRIMSPTKDVFEGEAGENVMEDGSGVQADLLEELDNRNTGSAIPLTCQSTTSSIHLLVAKAK